VTNLLVNTLVMNAGLIFTVGMSSLTVSILRNYTPMKIRMMAQTLIIASYVIIVDIAIGPLIFRTSARPWGLMWVLLLQIALSWDGARLLP